MTTTDNGIVRITTTSSVSDVLQHLLSILRSKAITVFAVIDHSGEADRAGFEMPNTKLVIFGDPKAGTPLMITAPDIALDLPLKILLAANNDGTTTISYNDLAYIKTRFELSSELMARIAGIEKIAAMLAQHEPLTPAEQQEKQP